MFGILITILCVLSAFLIYEVSEYLFWKKDNKKKEDKEIEDI